MQFGKKRQVPMGGMPGWGSKDPQTLPPQVAMELMNGGKPRIGEKEIAKAAEILQRYKDGKASLEERIISNDQWYKMQHWSQMRKKNNDKTENVPVPQPTSGWLFNSLSNKHADAMDNFPEPMVLPREQTDQESARALSDVLPVVMEYNDFETTYDRAWWRKLKNGAVPYGVFWNKELGNGLGDVEVVAIDMLKLFWEPGITDLQDSSNLFICELVDEALLNGEYPEHTGKMKGSVITLGTYIFDDAVDNSEKCLVVDWYYKVKTPGGKTVVHYAKFAGSALLYASENDPNYQQTGWYADGSYPVVMDVLFPEEGTPAGFGYVDICKDPQMYIDKLWANILKHSDLATRLKFFVGVNTDIDEKELMDPTKVLVHCSGEVNEDRLKQILVKPLDAIYASVLQMKVDEMKDTSSNRDVNQGSTSGATAAAAIAALQEAGNKTSRDMLKGAYRAYAEICRMVVERMRQFYTEERTFRITNTSGGYSFMPFSNAGIVEQQLPPAYAGQELEPGYEPVFRVPIFDIKIHAQRKNPFSRMEQNERALSLYSAGFFMPEKAQESLMALDMMDFEGIDEVREKVRQGQTLLNIVQQMAAKMDQMAMIIQSLTGAPKSGDQNAASSTNAQGNAEAAKAAKAEGTQLASAVMASQQPQTPYMQQMVHRSTPKME